MAKKVLLIENDTDVRDMITYVLEDEGLTVLHLIDPGDLDIIAAAAPDLILIDEWLSAEPGHRLCLRIKQFSKLTAVRVIIMSTAHDIEVIAAECHADDYIRKPFDLSEMVEKVCGQLRG